jgi:hypothetical protein
MPIIEVKGLDELVAKLRELASGKYLDSVVRASRARLARTLRGPEEKSVKSSGFVGSQTALIGRQGLGPRQVISLQRGRLQQPIDAILADEAKQVEADLVAAVEEVLN